MIITLEGVQGSGKTLSAVAMCYKDKQRGRNIFSNNHLSESFGNYTFFDVPFFLERMGIEHGENAHDTDYEGNGGEGVALENSTLLLDEAYIYLDSRTSGGKLNKLFTYFTVQTRKRGVDMYVCTHHIDVLDKRLRRAVDVRGTCRYLKEDPCRQCKGLGYLRRRTKPGQDPPVCPRCLGYGHTGFALTDFTHQHTGQRSRGYLQGPAFWQLYDTTERIKLTKKTMKIKADDM